LWGRFSALVTDNMSSSEVSRLYSLLTLIHLHDYLNCWPWTMHTNQSMATLSARRNIALDPSSLLTSSSRTSSRMTSTDPSLSSTLQIHILPSTHANLLPYAQSVHHTKTLRPLHHTRNFFPQATDPLFVPSETDVPESWRPRFYQTEKNTPARTVLFMIGFFMLAALWPVTAGLVR
jgi:hypothetical protein